jgi:hypothetical protein
MEPRFDDAAQMVKGGKVCQRLVLRSQIPNFDDLDACAQYLAEKALHAGSSAAMEVENDSARPPD